MMEPDIRMETNREGFCFSHFQRMLKAKNRLSLALMLESRLAYVAENELSAHPAKGGLFRKNVPVAPQKAKLLCLQRSQPGHGPDAPNIDSYVGER